MSNNNCVSPLESLGADASVHQLFEPFAAQGLLLGRVVISQRDRYQVHTASGDLSAGISGTLRHRSVGLGGMPVTGDWVALRVAGALHAAVIAVLPRRTILSRRAAGTREDQQPIAANIDLVFLVCGLDGDFNLRRLERYLTLVAEGGGEPVVVLNKADLCPGVETRMVETAVVARGARIVPASTMLPRGLDGIRSFLAYGRTVALLGSSGVGKSAIVNCLLGEEKLRTGEVRESDSRGRHTTTQRELIQLPGGGILIDTPGMRELQLWAGRDSVDRTFDEIAEIVTACRFRNCSHSGESGCAVMSALAEGVVSDERWQSYRKLTAEAKRHEELTNPLAAAERKKRDKAIHKGLRVFNRRKNS